LVKVGCSDTTRSRRLPEPLVAHPCSVYYPEDETEAAAADNSPYNCCSDKTQHFTDWAPSSPFLNTTYSPLASWNQRETFCKTLPAVCPSPEQTQDAPKRVAAA